VARHDPEELQVTNLVRGRFRIEQGARTALVGAGDLSCYETSHPYDVTSPGRFELLLFSLPKALLGDRAEVVCARTAVALDGRTGAAALAGPFLRGVAERIEDGTLDARADGLSDVVVDLVRMLFAADPPGAAGGAPLFAQVVAYIDAHLGDPELGPRPIAAAHFVSVRQLHKVFEREGHTVAGWIRSRRLAAVCRDLADPALAEQPIRVLAARRGFVDAPHFNRLFRAEHGCTPGEFRHR